MKPEFDLDSVEITASKHFKNKYMYRWSWDFLDLRNAIKRAHKLEKIGKEKYEAYINWKGGKKIIFVFYKFENEIYIISGSEGK